ncbi:MAG: hypothetical protein KIT09_35370 [Bryobacteraceae bacterium]|nr:hypothetical protein [Bryobacteraceae bacterium]
MGVTTDILRLIAHILGTGLHLFLIVLLVAKRRAVAADRLALGAIACFGVWHFATAAVLYQAFAFQEPDPALTSRLETAAFAGLIFAPAFLLHLGLAWLERPVLWGVAIYAAPAAALWANHSHPGAVMGYMASALGASVALLVVAARKQAFPAFRTFYALLAGSVGLAAASALAVPNSAAVAYAALLPVVTLAYFIYRYNVLGILIGRRAVMVMTLAVVSAVYLLFVRWIGDFTALREGVFAGLIELSAIFAAAVLWLPLFEWMTRQASRRAELYIEYARQIIERAESILELPDRVQFLTDQIATLFGFRRVWLTTLDEPRAHGCHGCQFDRHVAPAFESLEAYVRETKAEMAHERRASDGGIRALLKGWGFSYAFPLWNKEQLIGMLLIDTAPRLYLDEHEPILLNLSREISHAIETCRLVEDKIRLEKALMRQEHLASLGKIAATIAHEVKNPLSSIKALSQLMGEDSYVAERYSRDIGFIVGETDRLATGVEQLLSFSRPAPEPKPEAPIYDLLESTAGMLAREYAPQQIRVCRGLDESLRDYLVDRQITQQIVLNLLLNAIQAAGPGGTVRLTASPQSEDRVAIEVIDDGPGIPEEMKRQVFEPFFTTRKKGTGLGLAIVKKNLDQLGGTIQLRSPAVNGRGSAFTMTIPAARKEAAP